MGRTFLSAAVDFENPFEVERALTDFLRPSLQPFHQVEVGEHAVVAEDMTQRAGNNPARCTCVNQGVTLVMRVAQLPKEARVPPQLPKEDVNPAS